MKYKNFKIFIRFLNDKFLKSIILFVTLALFVAILDASTALLIAPIFDLLSNQGMSSSDLSQMSIYTQKAVAFAAYIRLPQTPLVMMLLLFILIVVRNLFMAFSTSITIYIKEKIGYSLRKEIFEAVLDAKWGFYLRSNQGEFLSTLTREVNLAQNSFYYFSYMMSYLLQGILFLIVGLYVSWQLILSCYLITFILIAPFVLLTRWNYSWGEISVEESSLSNSLIQETFAMAKIIRSFGNQTYLIEKLDHSQKKLFKVSFLSQSVISLLHNTFYPLGVLSVIIGYYISMQLQLSFSEFSIILFLLWKNIPVLTGGIQQYSSFLETLPSFNNVLKLRNDAILQQEENGKLEFKCLSTGIKFESVTFKYDQNDVIKELSLDIPIGKMVALIGRSGSGKSTLADLLMGLHKPNKGAILLDGTPLEEFDKLSYRKKIGYVPQNSVLFNTTIRNNFLWINPNFTEDEIVKACHQAYALEFIIKLPDGIDTMVGDRGVRLSGGQVQRLALARAIALKPELLILDEATSALDSESELFIQESIESLSQSITILVIAHRLSTLRKADYVYLIDEGKIIEQGKPNELELESSKYQQLLIEQGLYST